VKAIFFTSQLKLLLTASCLICAHDFFNMSCCSGLLPAEQQFGLLQINVEFLVLYSGSSL